MIAVLTDGKDKFEVIIMGLKSTRSITQQISRALHDVAHLLPANATKTVLLENWGKHLHEIEHVINGAKQNGTLLDVGGGVGVNLLVLSRVRPDLKLFLVDRFQEYTDKNKMGDSESALALLNSARVSTVKLDFVLDPHLPYDDGYFDIVTCFDVVEHLPCNPLTQLGEVRRTLKAGGYIYLSGPNAISLAHRQALMAGKHPYMPFDLWCGDNYYSHYREYSPAEFYRLLEMTGFEEIQVELRSTSLSSLAQVKTTYQSGFLKTIFPRIVLRTNWVIEKFFPKLRGSVFGFARRPGP